MKYGKLLLIGAAMLTCTSCVAKEPDANYGMDFNTPEFFLARLDLESSVVSINSSKKTISDKNGEIRDLIFRNDDFNYIDTFKPTTKNYFKYHSRVGQTTYGPKFAEMVVYTDGNLRINYKEPMYKQVSFYFTMEAEVVNDLYIFIKDKINTK